MREVPFSPQSPAFFVCRLLFFGCQIILFLFPLPFLSSWALHCTTVDVIYDAMRWQPATLQPTDWAIPRISLIVPESSLARDQCHICWAMNVDDLIKSDVSTVLNAILLLSVSWWFEGFDDQGRNRRYCLSLGLSVLNGQFHCNPQTLPITSCLGDVITDLFWR